MAKDKRMAYREALEITDDLDECLREQPQLFDNVGDEAALAESRHDYLKLELDEAIAELDQQIRQEAFRRDEKTTETGIENKLRVMPKIKQLNRDVLDAKLDLDRWKVLRESFSTRGGMLRKLVDLEINKLMSSTVELGSTSGRAQLREGIIAHAQKLRAEEREEKESGSRFNRGSERRER